MATNLKPSEVAAWMREQAQFFNELAQRIESTFGLNGHLASRLTSPGEPPLEERICDLLEDGKARRSATIGAELGAAERSIKKTAANSQRLITNERGWITLIGGDGHG